MLCARLTVLQVFQHLWGTSELLSSFDSINVLRPGSHVVSTDDWLHCDQAPHRKGLVCIQGLVNMVDVGPDTGGAIMEADSDGLAACYMLSFCVPLRPTAHSKTLSP